MGEMGRGGAAGSKFKVQGSQTSEPIVLQLLELPELLVSLTKASFLTVQRHS